MGNIFYRYFNRFSVYIRLKRFVLFQIDLSQFTKKAYNNFAMTVKLIVENKIEEPSESIDLSGLNLKREDKQIDFQEEEIDLSGLPDKAQNEAITEEEKIDTAEYWTKRIRGSPI